MDKTKVLDSEGNKIILTLCPIGLIGKEEKNAFRKVKSTLTKSSIHFIINKSKLKIS
ncbi:hypothetical protein L6248_00635 [Candidatus Parcubacteria bacterium]|nr:hypothetical protein [Candidatus Parcubacteria bacterium]